MKLSAKRIAFILAIYFAGYVYLYQLVLGEYIYEHLGRFWYFTADYIAYPAFMILLIIAGGRWLYEQWDIFTGSLFRNIFSALKTVFLLYAVNILLSLALLPFGLEEAENQVNNDLYMQNALPAFLIGSIIFAPFAEEIVFRGCLCSSFGRKHFSAGALLSASVFGFMHISASLLAGNYINAMYFIVYASLGLVLALPQRKTGTVFTGVCAHMIYNLTAVLLSL